MATLQQQMRRDLGAFQRRIVARGEANLSRAVEAGALALDRALEDAVTDTGYYRMLIHGGRPGRHETGNMVSKIRHDGQTGRRDGGVTTMKFGWFSGDFEAYFREQDLGGPPAPGYRRGIPPAHALTNPNGPEGRGIAAAVAVEALQRSMRRG